MRKVWRGIRAAVHLVLELWFNQTMNPWPNKIPGANAGRATRLQVRPIWAARIVQFIRWPEVKI